MDQNNNNLGYDQKTFGNEQPSYNQQDSYQNQQQYSNYQAPYTQQEQQNYNMNNAQNGGYNQNNMPYSIYNQNDTQNSGYNQNNMQYTSYNQNNAQSGGYNQNNMQYTSYNQNNAQSGGYNQNNMQNGSFQYNGNSGGMSLSTFTSNTFLWMFLGLVATFATAIFCQTETMLILLFSNPSLPFILLIAELALVFILSIMIQKLSVGAAYAIFFGYAILNGVTFAAVLYMYEVSSVIFIFGMSALYFGGMALYGHFTKRDLTKFGPILFGGVIVMAVFWLLSMFLDLSAFETIMCIVGVGLFMALTAYDVQKIKMYHAMTQGDDAMTRKSTIICALQLYLDFINIFLYLLRLLGRRK